MRLILRFVLSICVLALTVGCGQNTENDTNVQTIEKQTDNFNYKNVEDSVYRFIQRSIDKTQKVIEELKFEQLHLRYMWPQDSMNYCRIKKLHIVNEFCSNSARRTDQYHDMCNPSVDIDERYFNILEFLSKYPSGSAARLLGKNLKSKYEKSVRDYLLPNTTITLNLKRERSFLRMLQDSLQLIE